MKKIFINIKDKIMLSNELFYAPHYLPHKFPIGEKICDEKCHIQKAKWRMKHHIFFCKYLKCPNYEFMIKKNQEFIDYKNNN